MKEQREKTEFTETDILSIPPVLLDMAGIPNNSDLVVEAIPGVLLIGKSEPLRQANQPLLDLFVAIGIKPEEVEDVIRKRGTEKKW